MVFIKLKHNRNFTCMFKGRICILICIFPSVWHGQYRALIYFEGEHTKFICYFGTQFSELLFPVHPLPMKATDNTQKEIAFLWNVIEFFEFLNIYSMQNSQYVVHRWPSSQKRSNLFSVQKSLSAFAACHQQEYRVSATNYFVNKQLIRNYFLAL